MTAIFIAEVWPDVCMILLNELLVVFICNSVLRLKHLNDRVLASEHLVARIFLGQNLLKEIEWCTLESVDLGRPGVHQLFEFKSHDLIFSVQHFLYLLLSILGFLWEQLNNITKHIQLISYKRFLQWTLKPLAQFIRTSEFFFFLYPPPQKKERKFKNMRFLKNYY